MPTLWFCVPAHGRVELARICLRQLRRTCDLLTAEGVEASAVVVACDENLDTARDLGFATVERDNTFLSRRFNDGIQLACDPAFNPRPVDYAVPMGSDDWVDHRILLNLPAPSQLRAFRNAAFVREDGQVIAARRIDYQAGVGIRVYPAAMLRTAGYRPADEDRKRACDTSILVNLTSRYRQVTGREPEIVYGDQHLWQIVDWKTHGEQLNDYGVVTGRFQRGVQDDPYTVLADVFDGGALDEMRAHYGLASVGDGDEDCADNGESDGLRREASDDRNDERGQADGDAEQRARASQASGEVGVECCEGSDQEGHAGSLRRAVAA